MYRFCICMLVIMCATSAQAGPKEDAQTAYDGFFSAFTTGNHEQMAGLFAPDALFFGTGSTELVTSHEGVRSYFTRALAGPAAVKATPLGNTALALTDDVVIISGKWQSERTTDGKMVTAGPARNTVVMHKRGGRWLIVQFHNSPTPKP
jgi:uncharacterized protein (TIGR02246 family)